MFKYGKPRGYLLDLVIYYALAAKLLPFARDPKITTSFLTRHGKGDE